MDERAGASDPLSLVVYLPTRKALETKAIGVQAEDASGSFGIRRGHEPFFTTLETGLLRVDAEDGSERWLAVQEGILLTDGHRVEVYTRDAHVSDSPGEIQRVLRDNFLRESEEERERRNALVRMQLAAFKMLFGYER